MELQRSEFIDVPVTRYVSEDNAFVPDHKYTSEEVFFDIELNGAPFTTAFCSPVDYEDLIIGMLAQTGRIRTADDVTALRRNKRGRAGVGGKRRPAAALLLRAQDTKTATGGDL